MKRHLDFVVFVMVALVVSLPATFAAELNLTYDANGNLVSGDGKYRVYNSLNQLWKVYNGSTNTTLLQEYVYDPLEERVALKRTYNSSGGAVESVYFFFVSSYGSLRYFFNSLITVLVTWSSLPNSSPKK